MQSPEFENSAKGLKTKSDRDLLRLYSEQNSQEAFAELGRRYANLIYTACLRETGECTLAEDAAQGVYLLLSRKAASLKNHETLVGWLYNASRYVAANINRQERRRQRIEMTALQNSSSSVLPSNPLWEQVEPHFHDALNRLKPAEREAILLRFVQQQSFAEVGGSLGISENTARMRVTRALEKIRTYFGKVGVAVTLSALTLLLEERAAIAAPTTLLQTVSRIGSQSEIVFHNSSLSRAVRRAARTLMFAPLLKPLAVLGVGSVLLGGLVFARLARLPRLTFTEQQQLFAALGGTWQGTLEFVDDRTRRRSSYPAAVHFEALESFNTLQFTAAYQGDSHVDITTFRKDSNTGMFAVRNGGEQSSHRLTGETELVRLQDGTSAFLGKETTQQRDLRIRIAFQADTVIMEEEYRTEGAGYQFRNRFMLRRNDAIKRK